MADGINGFFEFDYNKFKTETTDASGRRTETESESFVQLYDLTLEKHFYPNLRLLAGGTFEKNMSDFTNIAKTESTATRVKPFIDLRLSSPLYTAGGVYTRREEKTETSLFPSTKRVREEYEAILGWRPDGFPSINGRYSRTNTFDTERNFEDTTTDRLLLISNYQPIKSLDLRYQGSFIETDERINDLKVEEQIHSGRVSYGDRFFHNRLILSAEYNPTYRESEIFTVGTGEVKFQLFPFQGLSSIDDTPIEDPLDPNPALIDGNLTESSLINIGLPPPGGNDLPRNMGLDFSLEEEVNSILVWVDRDLPQAISSSFSWDIFTSSDNQDWTFLETVSPAPFGPFQPRFEINFSTVATRYLKVVVRPLTPIVVGALDFPDIFVTELQAFNRVPASEVGEKTTLFAHTASANSRFRILNTPVLFYELSYFFTDTDVSPERWTLSNGLSFSHAFSKIFSSSARMAREDAQESEGSLVAYLYTASIKANPLRTLRHSITFSGRTEEIEGIKEDRNSLFFYNFARLYKGIELFVSTGLSSETKRSGRDIESINIVSGTSIVPHESLTLDLSYTFNKTDGSGGERADTSGTENIARFGVSYSPFPRLLLSFSIESLSQEDRSEASGSPFERERERTLRNFTANWSPFPDGDLVFNVAYNEGINTEKDSKDRLFIPSVRWNITRISFLDLAYQYLKNESVTGQTESRGISATIRISL